MSNIDHENQKSLPISIKSLSKSYGDVHALEDVSLDIKAGEFITLLGPSGSGKTTLLKILTGLIRPISGSIIINKKKINISKDEYFKYFEYIGHENAIKSALTVRENLNFYLIQSIFAYKFVNHIQIVFFYFS